MAKKPRLTSNKLLLSLVLGVSSFSLVLGMGLILAPKQYLPPKRLPPMIQSVAAAVPPTNTAQTKTLPPPPAVLAAQTAPQTPSVVMTGIPILMYHYVGNNPNPKDKARYALSVSPDQFEAQMAYLSQNGYTTISLDTLYAIFNKQSAKPAKPIVLTFDDGYIDFYYNAFPILSKYHLSAVEFIPTGLVGKPAYMTWDMIKQIQGSGLVTFEAHTVNHTNLTSVAYQQVLTELQTSKNDLAKQTGYPVNFIAYPYGSVNNAVVAAAVKFGFVGGLGTWLSRATGPSMVMPRIRINGSLSLANFIAKVR